MNKELHLSRTPEDRKINILSKRPSTISKNTENYISGKNVLTDTPTHRNLLRKMKRERGTLFRKNKNCKQNGQTSKKNTW